MPGFILHSVDCTEHVQFLEMTCGSLPPAPEGYAWTACPIPATRYRVVLVDGVHQVIEHIEDPEVVLSAAKRAMQDEVNAMRAARTTVIATTRGVIDADDSSLVSLGTAVSEAMAAKLAGGPYSISWRLHDNSAVNLDADEMIALSAEVSAARSAAYAHSFDLKARIDATSSLDALRSIDVAQGWPQ